MNKEQIDTLLDDCTVGLRDDPELRLDARQELKSHIEAAADEHRAEGKNEEESLELAAKSFGSPMDVAGDLLEANRKRMKLRAWIRIGVRALLIPAAVIVAVFCGFSREYGAGLQELQMLTSGVSTNASGTSVSREPVQALVALAFGPHSDAVEIDTRSMLILRGDTNRESQVDQQKAIWEMDRTNRVFYGNYVTWLLNKKGNSTNHDDIAEIEEALRRGEQLDPDNSRHNYMLAVSMFKRGCELKEKKDKDGKPWFDLVINDRDLMEKGLAEFRKGNQKPFWSTYSREMLACRVEPLGPCNSLLQRVSRIGMAASSLFPHISDSRYLGRVSVLYGQTLLAEGRKDDAIACLEAWLPLSKRLMDGSFTLIEELVCFAIVGIGERQAVPTLEIAGEQAKAEQMKRWARTLLKPNEDWKQRRESFSKKDDVIKRRAGILTALLMPMMGEEVSELDLVFERWTWLTMIERTGTISLVRSFVISMLIMLLVAWRWRLAGGGSSAPLLLLPSARKMSTILLVSAAMPLGGYFLYSRFSGFSSHEVSPFFYWWWIGGELFLLGWLVSFLATVLLIRHVAGRCTDLGIALPRNLSWFKMGLIALIPFGLTIWLIRGKKEGIFRGTVARSLIPVFASVAILIGVTATPYLAYSERRLVTNDPVFACVDRGEGFSSVEVRLIQRLKKEFMDAMKQIEAESGIKKAE